MATISRSGNASRRKKEEADRGQQSRADTIIIEEEEEEDALMSSSDEADGDLTQAHGHQEEPKTKTLPPHLLSDGAARRRSRSIPTRDTHFLHKSIPHQSVDAVRRSQEIREENQLLTRKVSTSKDMKNMMVSRKEGCLYKQSRSFQRWKKRHFKLKGRKLYYAKNEQALIFNEIDLVDFCIAECGSKNVHAFEVITPFLSVVLCTDTRRDMDEWVQVLKSLGETGPYECGDEHYRSATSGQHTWYVSSHARPTYCNVCREGLSGMAWHGLSCEVCKMKVHKRCAVKVLQPCKWTTLKSIPEDCQITDEEEYMLMPHQWMEGNLLMGAKCIVCKRTCGSVLRLQDWACLWCRVVVHDGPCRDSYPKGSFIHKSRLIKILSKTTLQDFFLELCAPILIMKRAVLNSE